MKKLQKTLSLFLIMSLSLATLSIQSCGSKANKENTEKTSSSNSTDEATEKASSSSSNCDQIAEDYGKFVDEYVDIIEKYKKDPTNTSYLSDYTSYMQKAQTLSSDMQTNSACSADPAFTNEILKHIKRMTDAATMQ